MTGNAALTSREQLTAKERAENFPVALRALPARHRQHLRAVYDVARTLDDLGDEGDPGHREAALDAFGRDVARLFDGGEPQLPVLRALAPTVQALGLSRAPFEDLLAANRQDQHVTSYADWSRLREYCTLSADPVGRLVLAVFGVTDPRAVALSDQVCTALQLLEHTQDVFEDWRAGRVYLPADELARFGLTPADLDADRSCPGMRALVAFQTDRAERLLAAGPPLVALLHGSARWAVAGYVAGGRATVKALRRPGADVLVSPPRPRRVDVLGGLLAVVSGR